KVIYYRVCDRRDRSLLHQSTNHSMRRTRWRGLTKRLRGLRGWRGWRGWKGCPKHRKRQPCADPVQPVSDESWGFEEEKNVERGAKGLSAFDACILNWRVRDSIVSYQAGVKFRLFKEGDVAAARGHVGLIELKRKLGLVEIEGERPKSQLGNEGGPVPADAVPSAIREDSTGGTSRVILPPHNIWHDQERAGDYLARGPPPLGSEPLVFSSSPLDCAAAGGNLEAMEYLLSAGLEECSSDAFDLSAARGRVDILEWLHGNLPECTGTYLAMNGAAANGHLETVKWLHGNGTEGCTKVSQEPSSLGSVRRTVERKLSTDVFSSKKDRMLYVQNDKSPDSFSLSLSMYLVAWPCQFSQDAMDSAAGNGHLEVVKWLHQNRSEGCSWQAMDEAATNGHLDVVSFLHYASKE
ncbi:unnamed protein product, partial [Discosporangium mesarthrocarpum]